MFTGHQPTDMAEEEATVCIMWISISVAVFVMLTMITNPHIQTILHHGTQMNRTETIVLKGWVKLLLRHSQFALIVYYLSSKRVQPQEEKS